MQEFKQVPMAMLSGSGNKVKGGKKGQSSVESRLDYVVSKTPVTSYLVRYNGFRENIAAYSVGKPQGADLLHPGRFGNRRNRQVQAHRAVLLATELNRAN